MSDDRTPTPRARSTDAIDEALRGLMRSLDAHREESRERQKATDLRLADLQTVVERLDRHHAAAEAVARATETETTQIREAPTRIADVARRVDAIEQRIAEATLHPPIWRDPDGRSVISRVSVALLLALFASAGILSTSAVDRIIMVATAGLVPTAPTFPPPMIAPAPPTHPAHRPLPDSPTGSQL